MSTLSSVSARWPAVALGLFLSLPHAASAQGVPAANPAGQGPMTVERVQSGFLVTPEIKVTRFDHRTTEVVGADAGWLADKMFFIGGGGYWMANQSHDRQLAYGGLVLGLSTPVDSPFSVGVKTLLGGGRATVARSFTVFDTDGRGDGIRILVPDGSGRTVLPPITTSVRLRQDFVVLEPQVNVAFKMSKRLRLTAGAGYRWIGRERGGLDGLSGPSGSVGLQIGGGG
ncbi:MAG: hypothetical protein ABJA98_18530 [Acidobacteriota bacterium]